MVDLIKTLPFMCKNILSSIKLELCLVHPKSDLQEENNDAYHLLLDAPSDVMEWHAISLVHS